MLVPRHPCTGHSLTLLGFHFSSVPRVLQGARQALRRASCHHLQPCQHGGGGNHVARLKQQPDLPERDAPQLSRARQGRRASFGRPVPRRIVRAQGP
jgi:hypothetical protein